MEGNATATATATTTTLHAHRDNFVGDIVLVELLHVQQQLVGVGKEGFLRSAKPVANLEQRTGQKRLADTLKHFSMPDDVKRFSGRNLLWKLRQSTDGV